METVGAEVSLEKALALAHRFATSREGFEYKSRRNVFVVRHGTSASQLEQQITADLSKAGIDLVSDPAAIKTCAAAVVFATPGLAQHAGETALQALLDWESDEVDVKVHPVIVEGDFESAVPEPLRSFLVRNFLDESQVYSAHMLGIRPLGLVPDLWQLRIGDMSEYEAQVKLHLDTVAAGDKGLLNYRVEQQMANRVGHDEALLNFYDRMLLEKFCMKFRPSNHGAKGKVFISYAWEADAAANEQLQGFLQKLQTSLQMAGFKVFLDLADMSGDMKQTMATGIEQSGAAILIGTPRFKERSTQETNVAFEVNLIKQKQAKGTLMVLPLVRSGTAATSIPSGFESLTVRECTRDDQLQGVLVSVGSPAGLIPTIMGMEQNAEYKALVAEVQQAADEKPTTAAGFVTQHQQRLEHALKAHDDSVSDMNPEACREAALELEEQAKALDVEGDALKQMQMKAILEAALPRFVKGFGEDHENTQRVKAKLASVAHLNWDAYNPAAMVAGMDAPPGGYDVAGMQAMMAQAMGQAGAAGAGGAGAPQGGQPMMFAMPQGGAGGAGGMPDMSQLQGLMGMAQSMKAQQQQGGAGGMPDMSQLQGLMGMAQSMQAQQQQQRGGAGGMPDMGQLQGLMGMAQSMQAQQQQQQQQRGGAGGMPDMGQLQGLMGMAQSMQAQQQQQRGGAGAPQAGGMPDMSQIQNMVGMAQSMAGGKPAGAPAARAQPAAGAAAVRAPPAATTAPASAGNVLLQLHAYMATKYSRQEHVERMGDFKAILHLLKRPDASSAQLRSLVQSADFKHKNPFKGNRYQTLREQLCALSDTALKAQYTEYAAYLDGSSSMQLDPMSTKFKTYLVGQLE